jgi:hypothetical protein
MIKMMTASQPPRGANQHLASIRALGSITSQQADIIMQAVQTSGLAWTVQTTDDYDGYLSILVEPIVHGDSQKSFFIAGTTQKLELFEAYDDDMTLVASFSDVEAISARLLDLIAQHD